MGEGDARGDFPCIMGEMDWKAFFGKINNGISIADAVLNRDGLTDPNIGLAAMFDRRISTAEGYYASYDPLMVLTREDFPELKHRQEISFKSGKNTLRSYLYQPTTSPKGVVLCVHGLNSFSDNHNAIFQAHFLNRGYVVFAIDLTASGRSGGIRIDGLHQSALDIVEAEKYLKSRSDLRRLPLSLFGHSWGGYGVAASLALDDSPVAVVALSGFKNPIEEMVGLVKTKAGPLAESQRPALTDALCRRAGEYALLSAEEAIKNNHHTRVLLVHGSEDAIVPYPSVATAGCKFHQENVEKIILKGRTHTDLFFSEPSIAYAKNVEKMKNDLVKQYGKSPADCPKEVLEAFRSSFDKRMACVLDPALWRKIDETIDGGSEEAVLLLS